MPSSYGHPRETLQPDILSQGYLYLIDAPANEADILSMLSQSADLVLDGNRVREGQGLLSVLGI